METGNNILLRVDSLFFSEKKMAPIKGRMDDLDDGKCHQKLHKTCCCPKMLCACNMLFKPCRYAVSQKKVRYTEGDFDIDLTYITPRIIVHGFPATGIEHIYRNPRYELRRLFELKHKNHYKVYNFCCEPGRGYPKELFEGNIERYPFRDHHTPPLIRMVEFANSAHKWLNSDNENVSTLHCKAGKGRAGLMCCVLLIRTGVCDSAMGAFRKYDETRVSNKRGLTVPSQRRYVVFYEKLWRDIWKFKGDIGKVTAEEAAKFKIPDEPMFQLSNVEFVNTASDIGTIAVKVWEMPDINSRLIDSSKTGNNLNCTLKGNFKIIVYKSGVFKLKKVCEFMYNTLFLETDAEGSADFTIDQVDMSKKFKKVVGTTALFRLKFHNLGPSVDSVAGTDTRLTSKGRRSTAPGVV